ncbi:hypothetical protein FSP39_013947 [Pinctada imbricata]|uniref:TIR domain-containing protein n=1 Tax=Pinctada imbricata TaxID=66713 RepID=A0AA88XFE5_PINIB|nr:hypothetical protein FSP39_013947 [Pinctada imbricata]
MAGPLGSEVKCDIMISYNQADLKFTQKLCEKFEEQGWTVWYARPEMEQRQMLSQKGEAILSCKVFVIIMSEATAKDPRCQDELALSYISNSSIFPVGLKKFRDISPLLDGGMKLMLAKINWSFFFKDEHFESNMPALLTSIGKDIKVKSSEEPPEEMTSSSGVVQFHGMNINVSFTDDENDANMTEDEESTDRSASTPRGPPLQKKKTLISYDFWERNFAGKDDVTWSDFKKKFEADYKEKVTRTYEQDRMKTFCNLIYKDIFNLSKSITKVQYDKFCGGNPDADHHRFYHRLEEYAIGYYAMREVFDMESSLRLTTIQKLGSFTFPAVINGLTGMLKDDDPNIRAVATIALAKSGRAQKSTVDRIIGMLEDEDRLVRESACLALGSLKAGGKSEEAVANRWRNDPIKSVREAAEISLRRMGGDLAQRCIYVTDVLSSEMQALKTPMS